MKPEFQADRDNFHIPSDAGELADSLVAVMMRIPDGWGRWIACERGWYSIIIEIDRRLAELDPNYVVYQIKQKCGDLCFYFDPTELASDGIREMMNEIVIEGEKRAATTCEECGFTGVGVNKGTGFRVQTLCEACRLSGWG